MKLIIDIPEGHYEPFKFGKYTIVGGLRGNGKTLMSAIYKAIANGTPIPDNATNGQVLLQMFPPSVYFGDDEKHIVLLTKDCELTCYNNEWWNAPFEADKGDKE